MFALTEALKTHARQHLSVPDGANDAAYKQAIGQALENGRLTGTQLMDLTRDKAPSLKSVVATAVKEALGDRPAKTMPSFLASRLPKQKDADVTVEAPKPAKSVASVIAGNAATFAGPDIRVKGAHEWYDGTKKAAIYPEKTWLGGKHMLAGRRATHGGVPLDEPSEKDKAIAGAWFKFLVCRSTPPQMVPRHFQLTDHDRDLIEYAKDHMTWSGSIGFDNEDDNTHASFSLNRQYLPEHAKALLDDSTSGGIDIVPQAFDDAIVLTPVLYGELYPGVNVVPVTRGRRIVGGVSMNPTVTWGTAEGTSIGVLNTASFISTFNTTIFPAVGAIEIGLDFLEDAPAKIGQIIVDNYGRVFMQALDNSIATGDGTTQPLGIFNTAGVSNLATDNATAGPPTVSDYEALMFGVAKQYRTEAGGRPAFVGNDVSYARARGIQVNQTDQRRVFGLNEVDYSLLGMPYKVNAGIGNSSIAFVMLNRYRMYRRLGLMVRMETLGETLALKNEKLIVIRARYGGQMEQAGAMALTTSAQS